MSRIEGRRTRAGRETAPRRTAVLGLMVVALTAALLTLAGTTPRGVGARVQSFERVEVEQRTFSCPGGIPGATATHGSLDTGAPETTVIPDQALRFDDDQSVALGAFAGQEARSSGAHAWLPCPEPRARWWFVGAGAATVTHDTVLTVVNPRPGLAVLDVDVFGPKGPVDAPGLHGLTVEPGATRQIDLAKVAPAVGELAVSVVATRGLVAISAVDRFAPGVVGEETREWLPNQSLPDTSITLAGLPTKPDGAALIVVNPRRVEAIVSLEVIGESGTFAPQSEPTVTVPPASTLVVPFKAVFDGTPLAVRLSSTHPVTGVVRTVTEGDVAFATGVSPIRGTTALAVPAGTGQLVLSSLGRETSVALTVFDAEGEELLDREVPVAEATSVGVRLPAKGRYLQLVAETADAVAGFSVQTPAGVATAGVLPSIRSVLLPVVRPGW